MRSALAVPLDGPNGAIGVMTLYRADPDAFTRDHLRILLAISSKVSVAIENALLFRQLEDSATTDYLSGSAQCAVALPAAGQRTGALPEHGDPLCVVVCDLDGFKQVNDHLGHLEGNRVLQEMADILRGRCREYDYVARMGGDEFVLLLPGVGGDSIQPRIEELRRIAIEAAIPDQRVSMSVGQACYPDDGLDAEELLAAADKRMYSAKQLRRESRVIPFPPIPVARPYTAPRTVGAV